ncbi:MAG: hypothetical protein J6N67_03120 [Desulfovibrio sp.]|nr:hypothetical protein [Desulfovibrio sp.]
MRGLLTAILISGLALGGCGAAKTENASTAPGGDTNLSAGVGGKANIFNPFMNERLPNLRAPSSEGQAMLDAMGGHVVTIAGEAAHRPQWKREVYPVFFGNPTAPHEVLVLLDFAAPQSEKVWKAVAEAARSLPPQQAKVAVFANSREYYGTDLMGLGIWISYSRPGQAMEYMTYALSAWNRAKAAQGRSKRFNNEYDSVAKEGEFPIHYTYMTSQLRPPVPASQELAVTKYCYDAGNVNLYQAEQIAEYFGVKLPAVIVDGKPLSSVSAGAILGAMK